MRGGAFAGEIATTEATHLRGVTGSCRDIAALTGAEDTRFAVHGKRHFAGQDNVRGFCGVRVRWIVRVWAIDPGVGVGKAFTLQLG